MIRSIHAAVWLLLGSAAFGAQPTVGPAANTFRLPPCMPSLTPALCDAQGRLVCRQFEFGPRTASIARITVTDGVVKETPEVRTTGYGPLLNDYSFDANNLVAFGLDGKPLDVKTLRARLSQLTPVLWVEMGGPAPCMPAEAIEPGGPLLDAFRSDLVIILNREGKCGATISKQAVKKFPPPPPPPVRVSMDAKGRLVFKPQRLMLSFEGPVATGTGGGPSRPTQVTALATRCDRFAVGPELVTAYDTSGREVDARSLPRLLSKETAALLCSQAPAFAPACAESEPPKLFDSFYLRAAKPGTLLFHVSVPLEAAAPAACCPAPAAAAAGFAPPACPAPAPAPWTPLRSGTRGWAPEQAVGAPDTKTAGDRTTAWASATPDGQDEWLRVRYAKAVKPSAAHVYETYNPGALRRITAVKNDGQEVELWSGQDPVEVNQGMGVARVSLKSDSPVDCIALYLSSSKVPGVGCRCVWTTTGAANGCVRT
jgi:hypothetical protein